MATEPRDTGGDRGEGRPRLARLVPALLLIATGALLGAGVAEVGLRLAGPRVGALRPLLYLPAVRTEFDDAATTPELLERGYFGYHPHGVTPGFRLNRRGFRTDEYAAEPTPGVPRIIALGDSFTFDSSGVPIDRMWHQVAEAELARRTGRPVEVLSLSAPAVGPRFLLRLWELEGRGLAPDLVVFAFFVGNDFVDERDRPLGTAAHGWWLRHSHLARLLRNAARLAGEDLEIPEPPAPGSSGGRAAEAAGGTESPDYAATYDPLEPTFSEERFLQIERDRMGPLLGPDGAAFGPLCEDAARVLERLARDVEARGARFLVMLIPDEAQVDPGLRERLFPPSVPLDVERPQRCLGRELEARGILRLDLLPAFRERFRELAAGGRTEAAGERLYKLWDTHWSAAGNRLAGRVLARHLLAAGLVGDGAPGGLPQGVPETTATEGPGEAAGTVGAAGPG